MTDLQHVAFCGGGSGGHLTPSIAVAQTLLERSDAADVTFLTSSRSIDARILADARLPVNRVAVVQQPISSSRSKLSLLRSIVRSFFICRRLFRKRRPEIVVGTGGFASIAGVIAAWWLKIPVVLLEINAVPGRANRLLNRFARSTCFGLDAVEHHLKAWRGDVHKVGVPIRTVFSSKPLTESPQQCVLVLGGSQGAANVNRLCLDAFAFGKAWPDLHVLHQAGETEVDDIQQRYRDLNITADVVPFVSDVAAEIAIADVVISRAGAVTLAEISAVRRPVVLIPLSTAADDHQRANAASHVGIGAAVSIDETVSDAASRLNEHLTCLLDSFDTRTQMQDAQQQLAAPNATDQFLEVLHQIVSQ